MLQATRIGQRYGPNVVLILHTKTSYAQATIRDIVEPATLLDKDGTRKSLSASDAAGIFCSWCIREKPLEIFEIPTEVVTPISAEGSIVVIVNTKA